MKKRIAIIGAGLSGLTLANRLRDYVEITVFEKARGVGGRMSTRHHDSFTFDHGAQFFTLRDKRFAAFLVPHLASGLIQEWTGKTITLDPTKKATDRLWFETHYVACPGMNNLCKTLADGIVIELNREVMPLGKRTPDGWDLSGTDGHKLGTYDCIISTAPPIQTCRLFDLHLSHDSRLRRIKLLPCYTMMLGFNRKWDRSWIAAKIRNSPLEWIAVNSTKPGRNNAVTTLVVHSSNTWAEEHADDDFTQTERFLRDQLDKFSTLDFHNSDYFSCHRWRYALVDKEHNDRTRDAPFYDEELNLASVGDWGSRSRVEDVWLEANMLADKILLSDMVDSPQA